MTVIEVIVALALFAVLAASVLSVLGSAMTMTNDDKNRLEAINLATRELEITRDAFTSLARGPDSVVANRVENPNPLVDGVPGEPLVIDNVPYTIVRTAQWTSVNSAAVSTCDEGTNTELAYLRVKVEVRWAGLDDDRPPVTMDTVMTPPKGTYSAFAGHIGVKIIDALGRPSGGLLVTANGPSGLRTGVTSADGCALFGFLDPGTYEVTVNSGGYVDRKGNPTGSTTAQVQPGQLWRGAIEYDNAATITASFTTQTGYALPATNNIPVAVGNSAILPAGSRAITGSSNTRSLNTLWPYPSGYQLWAGPCLDNDPQYTGDKRDLPVSATPGGFAVGTVELAALDIRARANRTVTATHAADTACPGGATIVLGVTNSSGQLRTSIPFGRWTINDGLYSGVATVYKGDPVELVVL